MTDNNDSQSEKSTGENISSQEEIGEKRMSDKSPLQNTRDNNKINRGNLIKSAQQINETKQKEQPSYKDGKSNQERLLSLSINMIIISIIDLFFQSIFRFTINKLF